MFSQEVKQALHMAQPFKYLEVYELDMLLAYCKIVNFSDQEKVVQQGQKTEGMYVIVKGKALIIAKTLGKDVVNLATLSKGDFIGEDTLIDESQSSVSVIAEGNLQCLLITATYFSVLSLIFPETKYKVTKAISDAVCSRLRNHYEKIISVMKSADMVVQSLVSTFTQTFVSPESTTWEAMKIDIKDLHHSELLKKLSDEEYAELLTHTEIIYAPPNCDLLQKSKNTACFLVLRGGVQITISESNKVVKLAVLGPMTLFSGMTCSGGEKSILNYITRDRCVLIKVSQESLDFLQKNNPPLWFKIFDEIGKSFVLLVQAAEKLEIRLNSELYNR